MANHKRGRPKYQRAGCILCKPWKGNASKEPQATNGNLRRKQLTADDLEGAEGVGEETVKRLGVKTS